MRCAWLIAVLSSVAVAQDAVDAGVEPALAEVTDAGEALPLIDVADAGDALPLVDVADAGAPDRPQVRSTVVRERGSHARRLSRSAEAVDVVDTREAQAKADDLAEVLTRQSAVQVQRGGGLGSATQLSLAGLAGDQVRVLLDGVPIDYSPFSYGLGNVPVSFIQQLEIFNGVVPVRLASDALGGVIHLRSDLVPPETGGSVSLQAGSFDSYRATARASWLHPSRHFYVRAAGFHDQSRNDYVVTVKVPNASGQVADARVHRNHDGYMANGVNVEAGLLDLSWADRLVVHAYFAQYDKDIPHNVVMTTPYGEVTQQRRSLGVTLWYAVTPSDRVSLSATAGWNRRFATLHDVATCVYDWYGRCVAERPLGGEIGGQPQDLLTRFDTVFGRARAQLTTFQKDDLELSAGVDQYWRLGRNAYVQSFDYFDPLAVPIAMTSGFAGASHRQRFFDDRLENVVFAKGYLQHANIATDPRSTVTQPQRTSLAGGAGDTVRFAFTRQFAIKASYEYATRLPRADELFGDGAFLLENTELAPERSHNGNAALELTALPTPIGVFSANVTGSVRALQNLIVLIASNQTQRYESVGAARALSLQGGLDWTSPGRWVSLGGNTVVTDYRNLSESGSFARFNGDRIPYRPWLQASASLTLRAPELFAKGDQLSFEWNTRYVHEFYRSWESAGLASTKQVVPSQLLHFASLTYRVLFEQRAFAASLAIHNLTDAPSFDLIGVQRPGRAVFGKLSIDL